MKLLRRFALVSPLIVLGALATLRAEDEWKPPENGEVREKAVLVFVAALERAKAEGYTIGATASKALTWIGPFGCSPSGMDEETVAAIESAGVSRDEAAWTGERLLEVMKLLHLGRTPAAELEKQERELGAELARRAATAKAAFPADSTWTKGIDAVVKLEEKNVELLRGHEAPGRDPELAKDQLRARTLGGFSVVLRLQALRSAANELETIPAHALDLLDELEDARIAHSEAGSLLEQAVLRDPKKLLEEQPKKNVELAQKHDAKVRELLVAMGWKPFVPAIAPRPEPHHVDEREVGAFVTFLSALAKQKYSLADAPPHGALSPVDLSPLDPGNEVDDVAVAASGLSRNDLFTAGNRIMELVTAVATRRTPSETWKKKIDEERAAIDTAREALDKAHPNADRAKLTKAFVEHVEKKKAVHAKLKQAYENELLQAGKAFENPDAGVGTPTEGTWQDLMKADRECLELMFAGLQVEMDYWTYVGDRRMARGTPKDERKALDELHVHADRKAMLEVFARAARQGETLLARMTASERAALDAKLGEIEKLLRAMESPLYEK